MRNIILSFVIFLLPSFFLFGCSSTPGVEKDTAKPADALGGSEVGKIILPSPELDTAAVSAHTPIPLWAGEAPYNIPDSDLTAEISVYLADGSDSAVIIFPGGGYFQVSMDNEGRKTASEYNKLGISAFAVNYRHDPYGGDAILADGMRAIQWVRFYADELGIDPDKIAVCGFSAGGHLAMLTAEHSPDTNLQSDGIGEISSKPNALILGYPVVTLGDGTYPSMPSIFLGEKQNDAELIGKYSYTYAPSLMPPTFIFSPKVDSTVDKEKNAIALTATLRSLDIACDYREYTGGHHGSGATGEEFVQWVADSADFLKTFAGF